MSAGKKFRQALAKAYVAAGADRVFAEAIKTRMDLYEYLGYHDYEQKLDSLFAQGKNK